VVERNLPGTSQRRFEADLIHRVVCGASSMTSLTKLFTPFIGTNKIDEMLRSFLNVMSAADPGTPKHVETRFAPIVRREAEAQAR
jgi:hypothetical protein